MASFVQAGIPASEAAAAARAGESTTEQAEAEPEAHPLARSIASAARAFDGESITAAFDEAVAMLDWPGAIDQVLMPALILIGESWRESELDLASEHFASEIIRHRLGAALAGRAVASPGAPGVLLACPEDERHELGLLATCLLLRDCGLRTVYLGADVPTPSLLTAIQATGVDAACLAATTESGLAMLTRAVRAIARARLSVKVFVGGHAVHSVNGTNVLGIRLPESISATARQIQAALDG